MRKTLVPLFAALAIVLSGGFAGSQTVLTTQSGQLTFRAQEPALVFAGPATGSAAVPTFRALLVTDLPGILVYHDDSDGETLVLTGATTDTDGNLLHANSEIGWVMYRITTTIEGVHAVGTITMSGVATANQEFVVGAQTFVWKALRAATGQVTIGASASAAVTNIVAAITADLATVTAADGTGDTVVVTAVVDGAAGNTIAFSEGSTNMAMDEYEETAFLGGTTAGADVTGFTIGDPTSAARFCGSQTTLDVGTTGYCYAHRLPTVASEALSPIQSAAAKVRITAAGAVPSAGAIKIVVPQRTWTAPAS
jgi:hypothetical protein